MGISDLLADIVRNRVKRIVFTDNTGFERKGRKGREEEDGLRREWKQTLMELIGDLILAAKSGYGCDTIQQNKFIEFWPDTQLSLTTLFNETEQPVLKGIHYDRESECSTSTSFASTLFGPLACTLATLLNVEFTLHTLKPHTDLIVLTPLSLRMRFIVPLNGTPVISSRLYSEITEKSNTFYREDWTLVLSPDMTKSEVGQRVDYLLHSLNGRRMRMSKGEIHSARLVLEYEPREVVMEKRRELVDAVLYKAGGGGSAGSKYGIY